MKGTRLHRVPSIELGREGARGDRRFIVSDGRDRMVNSKPMGQLHTIVASVDDGRLSLTFPDGRVIHGPVELGEQVATRFYSETLDARVVVGPWNEALSELLGKEVRLVEPARGAIDRGPDGAASLISRASLDRLAAVADEPTVDSRRFRMLIEVDGVGSHEEDGWVGTALRIGDAVVRFSGHVGRCLITSRHPETGQVDLPTLDILDSYRRDVQATEPLPFGIYGEVLEEGAVRVGDEVSPLQ